MIVAMLADASSEMIDEMTQIRVLQMLLTFLDPTATILSKEFVNSVLRCCFQMFDTKSNAVKSTIQATLKALFTLFLDQFTQACVRLIAPELHFALDVNYRLRTRVVSEQDLKQIKQKVSSMEHTQIYSVVCEVVQNLAFTLMLFEQQNSKKSQHFKQLWNLKSSPQARCVIFDLINLCLGQSCIFKFFPEILNLFQLQIVPTLEQMLQQKVTTSLIGVRLMKCAVSVINNLQTGYHLFQYVIQESETFILKAKDGSLQAVPGWRNLVAFECLQIAISNPEHIHFFATTSQQNMSILLQIFDTYLRAVKAIETYYSLAGYQNNQNFIGSQKIAKLIDAQIIDQEIQAPPVYQIERILIESVCTFSDNFVMVFQAIGVKLGTSAGSSNRYQNFKQDSNAEPEQQCRNLLQLIWKPVVEVIQRLIKSSYLEESSVQMLLKAYQSCIGACGSANCFEARDAFLNGLCSQCVSSQYPSSYVTGSQKKMAEQYIVTDRNILICKTLLNIAHCLCHVLDVKSWFLILETMQKVQIYIEQKLEMQQQVSLQDVRSNVIQRIQDFNIIERNNKKSSGGHTRISSSSVKLNQKQFCDENLDYQILYDSLNSLFTSTLMFDGQSLAELICALAQLTVTTMQENQQKICEFGIRRLLETSVVNVSRIQVFWKILVAHFEILFQIKNQAIRQLTIDTTLLLVQEVFMYKRSSGVEREEDEVADEQLDEMWDSQLWQSTILQPLIEQLKSSFANDKIIVLKGVEKIIQTQGQILNSEGWKIILLIASKSLECEYEQVVNAGFRCLKLIVSNFVSQLDQQNFKLVVNTIHMFASNLGDNINSNLSAIGMFQNVADFISKQIKQQSTTIDYQATWIILLQKIQSLGEDFRSEVRRANIITLENVVMTHGQTFDTTVWETLMKNLSSMITLAVIKNSGVENSPISTNSQACATPQFSQQKKINFEEASVSQALKQNNEHWEDTCAILIDACCRTLKKFQSSNPNQSDLAQGFWSNLCCQMVELIDDNNSLELVKTIFKSVQDTVGFDSVVSSSSINLLLKSTKEFIKRETDKSQDDKNKVLKLLKSCPVFVEAIQKICDSKLLQDNMVNVYGLLGQLVVCSSQSEAFQSFGQPLKLLTEEKILFDFIESLAASEQSYIDFICSFLQFNSKEQRSESFVRRALLVLYNTVLKGKYQTQQLELFIPKIFNHLIYLLQLRYDEEAVKVQIFQAKGQQTLFFAAGLFAIHFASFLINPEQFKARLTAHQRASSEQRLGAPKLRNSNPEIQGETGAFHGDQGILMQYPLFQATSESAGYSDMLFSESQLDFKMLHPDEICAEVYNLQSLKDLVWEQTQSKLLCAFLFDPNKMSHHQASNEVIKQSQDLDMQVINFIVNCLLPNLIDHHANQDYEQRLIGVIDTGCQQLQQTGVDSLSKYCLSNLFELCKKQEWPSSHESIRKRIANISTPILVNRCQATLKRYISDELKMGSNSLPKHRVQEVTFILKKLLELNCGDKLVELMPVFADMVMSSEQTLKELLRKVFLEISVWLDGNKKRCSTGNI